MRAPEDKIKEALLHPDPRVRELALEHFGHAHRDDPHIMPAVVEAIKKYGWKDAFASLELLDNLPQTHDTIEWLLTELEQIGQPTDEEQGEIRDNIAFTLAEADPAELRTFAGRIENYSPVPEAVRDEIAQRIRSLEADPEQCWKDLEAVCEREKHEEELSEEGVDEAYRLVETVAREPDRFRERVREVLAADVEEAGESALLWLEGFAVRLAGEMRLAEAAPKLIEKLHAVEPYHDQVDWLAEECERALIRIDGDETVQTLEDDFPSSSWSFQQSAISILQGIHTDRAEQALLNLLAREHDLQIRQHLCRALLVSGSEAGLEAARRVVTEGPLDPAMLDLRQELLAAAEMMGAAFPEQAAWREETKGDEESRRRWYSRDVAVVDNYTELVERRRTSERRGDFLPAATSLMFRERVGRNDPCPCGSGKKYKKCCMRK
ncbi:MAG: SEC-C domain-containing protein [Planctomycetes bacterium]|nr:SEC-C domain-containing protein [Planctomycetota bacterium]